MTDLARVQIRRDADVVVAAIEGELDLANTAEIRSTIISAVANEVTGVVVDLSATSYLDSTGLSLLFDLGRRLSRRQQVLRVVAGRDSPVRRLLDLAGLSSVATIDERESDAVAAIKEVSDGVG